MFICLAVVLGGCQAKEAPLSKEAQTLKQEVLGELEQLGALLLKPAAQEDWPAAKDLLQAAYEEMVKSGKAAPFRIGVLDRHGVVQGMFPPAKEKQLDFSGYTLAKTVYTERKTAKAVLYVGEIKIFIVVAPLHQQDRILGAVALGFTEEELEKTWKVSEKEFLAIDFNK
jgi:hypothetical protein